MYDGVWSTWNSEALFEGPIGGLSSLCSALWWCVNLRIPIIMSSWFWLEAKNEHYWSTHSDDPFTLAHPTFKRLCEGNRSLLKIWSIFVCFMIWEIFRSGFSHLMNFECAHVDKMKPRNTTFLPLATSTDSINCRSAKNHVTQSPQATLNTVYTGC